MPTLNLDQVIEDALELLPPAGQSVEFDEYKAQLYAKYPEAGQPAFARMIKGDLVKKVLDRNADGKPVVMLSRLS